MHANGNDAAASEALTQTSQQKKALEKMKMSLRCSLLVRKCAESRLWLDLRPCSRKGIQCGHSRAVGGVPVRWI